VLALLEAIVPVVPHARRFEWLYRDNPDGPAWSWFAVERGSGSAVGMTSVFPRMMWVGSHAVRCGQVGDFAILPSHRSLGPALQLQRATFQPVDGRLLSFCYDCPPHAAGMATFRRLGVSPNCAVARFALPLRIDRRARNQLGFAPPVLTSLLNAALRFWRRRGAKPVDFDIAVCVGRFGDEFSQLDRELGATDAIRGCRSAAHLNWRYRDDPLQEYEVLTARRKGELIAALVFSIHGENIRIIDLFGRELAAAAVALLDALAREYERSCQNIEAYISEGNELARALADAHFHRRSLAAHVVAYAEPGSAMAAFLERRPRWAFYTAELQA
jgi:hypothetical protein